MKTKPNFYPPAKHPLSPTGLGADIGEKKQIVDHIPQSGNSNCRQAGVLIVVDQKGERTGVSY